MRLVETGPDALDGGASTWLNRFEMRAGDGFGTHTHHQHQLCWSPIGVLVVDVAGVRWWLPPTLALWIPSELPHDVRCARAAHLHSLYAEPARCPIAWAAPTSVGVGRLQREVIVHVCEPDLVGVERARAERFLYDLLHPLGERRTDLRLPTDERGAAVAEGLLQHPADDRTLEEWGRTVGASGRTGSRRTAGRLSRHLRVRRRLPPPRRRLARHLRPSQLILQRRISVGIWSLEQPDPDREVGSVAFSG